jgi:hypothetical protein
MPGVSGCLTYTGGGISTGIFVKLATEAEM